MFGAPVVVADCDTGKVEVVRALSLHLDYGGELPEYLQEDEHLRKTAEDAQQDDGDPEHAPQELSLLGGQLEQLPSTGRRRFAAATARH